MTSTNGSAAANASRQVLFLNFASTRDAVQSSMRTGRSTNQYVPVWIGWRRRLRKSPYCASRWNVLVISTLRSEDESKALNC